MTLTRWRGAVLALVWTAGTAGCTKDPPRPVQTRVRASEHVASSPVGSAQTVLEKTFPVKTSAAFPFQIPAHAASPHLHGVFESYIAGIHGGSDETANVNLLILTEQQYTDFAAGQDGGALFSSDASHNQTVNFDMPPSLEQPLKYYLVFQKAGGDAKRVVRANFRVDF